MGRNRLKDVFSTNPPLPEIKLLFQNFVNILKHAIIKRIIDEGEQTRLIYGETDSNPMQLFFTAFLSEQEAAEEHANAKDKEAEYTKARTAADYFHVIDDSFNP